MRIIIISTARTGGKKLAKYISNELGYHKHHEPETCYVAGFNIVVKVLVDSALKHNMETHNGFDPGRWDKIITLKRNDIRKAAESMTIAQSNGNWHSSYSLSNNWIKEHEPDIKENEIFIGTGNKIIDKIDFAGLKVTYEGIYDTGEDIPKLQEYLGITNPQYEFMLDKRHRYRKEDFI